MPTSNPANRPKQYPAKNTTNIDNVALGMTIKTIEPAYAKAANIPMAATVLAVT